MQFQERYWQAKFVTLIGALVNTLLGFMKLIGGLLFHSHALVADGLHSFSDLMTDIMVLFASKYGSLDADDTHPYGHQRIETAATLMLSLLLIMAGTGIAWDACDELLNRSYTKPDWFAIPIICFSIIANEALFHYTRHIGKKIQSQLIIANAWHHRADAASSVVVFIGLLGSLFGFIYLDAVAAIIVGLMIIKMGWDYGWNSVKELVDTGVPPETIIEIEKVIKGIDGVQKIHQLRTRLMGGDIFIDVHVLVSPMISVSEGHYIAQQVHQTLINQLTRVKDVTVHIDPEDDEITCPSVHLPNRSIINRLLKEVHTQYPEILFWNLHYLDGKMSVDIYCSKEFDQYQKLHDQVLEALQMKEEIAEVRLFNFHECHQLTH